MKTIDQLQDEIIEEFEGLDDWMDRYALIIDLGSGLDPMPEELKTAENLIDGCQSRVWIHPVLDEDGRLSFLADSDALIVKGIVAMLLQVLNGHTPQEILDCDLHFIAAIGLQEHLSPTRSNGLVAMVKRIRAEALALAELYDKNK